MRIASLVLVLAVCGCSSEVVNPFESSGATVSGADSTSTTDEPTTGVRTTGISVSVSVSASASDGMTDSTTDATEGSSGPIDETTTGRTDETTSCVTSDASTSGSSSGEASSSSSSSSGSSSSTSTGSCEQPAPYYDDCFNSGNGVCDFDASTCLIDDLMSPTHGTCAALDCVEDCDCPAAPATGTAESVCGEILAGGGTACFLDCSGGATCPDGMACIDNTLCMWPDLVCEDPPPAGTYGDCLTSGNTICNNAAATCLQDYPMNPAYAVFAVEDCVTDCDCPAGPGTGNATVSCGEIIADGGNACYLSCGAGETCPVGMTCFADFLCMWMP